MTPENTPSTAPAAALGTAQLDALLQGSSRTFALSIPLMPEPVRRQTTIAYLLFRIADTFEDEPAWSTEEKLAGLETVRAILDGGSESAAEPAMAAIRAMLDGAELTQTGYAELLDQVEPVLSAYAALEPSVRRMIAGHLCRTIDGMASYLRRDEPARTIEDVRLYCYHVAGIVGELLTDLFLRHNPTLRAAGDELRELAPRFGEALQLVNILRDAQADDAEGRKYIPGPEERAILFELADEDLRLASRYVELLERHGAAPGIVAFNSLNLVLAIQTIALVRERGPGAKLTRPEVGAIFERVRRATSTGSSVVPLLASA